MGLFLWLLVIGAVVSVIWFFIKLADMKNDTFREAENRALMETRLALQEKKKQDASSEQSSDDSAEKPQPKIINDPDSGISYE